MFASFSTKPTYHAHYAHLNHNVINSYMLRRTFRSLRIIVSSYHEKIYLTQGFSYTSDFLYYVIIFHFVSSYHEKINLTMQGLSAFHIPRIFYIMSLFFTSYHSIIVSRKNISYQGLSYTSDFYIMSLFFTSYHSIIVSRKNISYSGPFIYLGFLYYVIIFHFVS